jgi:outer membrane receptor protein involved in Fe transport
LAIEPRLFYSFEFVAGNYLDPSGRRLVPARALHGTGVEASVNGWLKASFEVRNLLDHRVTTWIPVATNTEALRVPLSDFIGYPLPGRSYWVSFSAKLDRSAGGADN